MANHGAGNKFVSVNLNKSYGYSSQNNQSSNGYGTGRARGYGYGGGGGGMVVLSRPRSSNKVGAKLSVPPPLNLPSLRKEHEKFDPTGSGTGSAVGGGLGSAVRPNSSGSGWSKLCGVASADRERVGVGRPFSSDGADPGLQTVEGSGKGSDNGAYMPPSARPGMGGSNVPLLPREEKASVLRGEDFPSLRATLAAAGNGPSQKQKDAGHHKQRQGNNQDSFGMQKEGSQLSSLAVVHTKVQHAHHSTDKGLGESQSQSQSRGSDNSRTLEEGRKRDDYLSIPLPLVRLSPRSDWADDERDTSSAFLDRDRDRAKDNGYSQTETYWDRDFDLPRKIIFPSKPNLNVSDRRTHHNDGSGKPFFTETPKTDFQARDTTIPSREGREGTSWRSPVPRVGMTAPELPWDRSGVITKTTMHEEMRKENRYAPPLFGGNTIDEVSNLITDRRDSLYGRRDAVYGHGGRQQLNNSMGAFSGRGTERNLQDSYNSVSSRHRNDRVQSGLVPRSSLSYSSKGLPLNDPLLNFGRDKRSFPRGEKPYAEEWGSLAFDERDPLSGGILGLVKRKKDTSKEVDFHDPERESFEAELERLQKLQEQERQRNIEKQERALEMARREEEKRQKLAREQEEHQRKLEEEAREAAWRAEQEREEAMRKAEEQRTAREEEKRRILMEEERRKQAAKQKLLELEERIARRKAEAANTHTSSVVADEKVPEAFIGKDLPREEDRGWEDAERIGQRIANSSSSDSSSLNRSVDVSGVIADGSSAFRERGKPLSSWRRDTYDNGNDLSFYSMGQDNGYHSPRRDAPFSGRTFGQSDFAAEAGYIPSRSQYRTGIPAPTADDLFHLKGSRWNASADGDSLVTAEKFDHMGWGHSRPRGNFNYPYAERAFQNSEQDELYPFGRSRYSSRQPRVLPPPSFPSLHRTSFRSENQHSGSLAHEEVSKQYNLVQGGPGDPAHGIIHSERQELSDALDRCTVTDGRGLNSERTAQCDSQSSLSVSSPPTSPTHQSHDDFDESGDAGVISAIEGTTEVPMSSNESMILNSKVENMTVASGSIYLGDDEEWDSENNVELQEQEEYDEDEVGYHEEDEMHGVDEAMSLSKEFEGIHLGEKGPNDVLENVVLGFDQGVEVRMPSDEYERSPRNEKNSYLVPQVSGGIVLEEESFEGRGHDGHSLEFAENSLPVSANGSTTAQQSGKETEEVVIQSTAASDSQSTSLLNPVDCSLASATSTSQLVSSSESNHQSSGQVVMSSAAAVEIQPELPVQLRFGLFSGPSLIPSPVPSIQIGSIQMPLQLHPQFGPSLTHMQPPQTPMFQFGQMGYPPPISQGILPLGPHSMAFVQPNVTHYPLNHQTGDTFPAQSHRESSVHSFGKDHSVAQSGNVNHVNSNQTSSVDMISRESNLSVGKQNRESDFSLHEHPTEALAEAMLEAKNATVEVGKEPSAIRNIPTSLPNTHVSVSKYQSESHHESVYGSRDGWTAHGQLPGSNSRNAAFVSRNPGQRSFHPPAFTHSISNVLKRRASRDSNQLEFRPRQSQGRRETSNSVSADRSVLDGASTSYYRKSEELLKRGSIRREKVVGRPNQIEEPEIHNFDQLNAQETGSQVNSSKGLHEEAPKMGSDVSNRGDGSLKRNISDEDDVDAPLQSGIVRIFKQPGIEAPSDADDFIEVRSKRQMLNDRREQREKEIKSKASRVKKASRRSQSVPQGSVMVKSTKKVMTSSAVEVPNVARAGLTQNRSSMSNEVSGGLKTMVWQPLAPIGTPPAPSHAQNNAKSQNIKSGQATTRHASGQNVERGSFLETESNIQDNVQTSIGSWGHSLINQQVMPLTQTQLDEAMKPAHYELPGSVNDPSISCSALGKDIAFSTAASPINSLLAGEKIQFGAVTSPTILPPTSRSVSHGISAPGPYQSDHRVSRKIADSKNEYALQFEKDKQPNDPSVHLEDCEAEAAAAASAVAAAAISSDEVPMTGLDACPVPIADTKCFIHSEIAAIKSSATAGDNDAASQTKSEDTLAVSLPADLSVETPPISLWPPLPSPQASSSQMLSPFSGGAPSHYPFYDINPMIGGPIIAFGPHGESPQSQPQKSGASGSGPLGTWQSGPDSFYGPPAGFTGPFINPPGNISGVQAPPHMVVYNHFAPVGQFGQVGLSYMGSTFIPSGKQPDWKHNPVGEGEATNLNVVSTQRSSPSLPPIPVQHLAPGSRVLPMPQPFAMFDVSPFQSSAEMPLQGRWTHIPPPPLHPMGHSTPPIPQQAGVPMPPQFNQGSTDNHSSLAVNRLPMSQSAPVESVNSFTGTRELAAGQFPVELGLVDATISAEAPPSSHVAAANSLPGNMAEDAERSDVDPPISASKRIPQSGAGASYKSQAPSHQRHSSGEQYHHPSGYNNQRAPVRDGSGSDWSHRRMGFHVRNHSFGNDRGFPQAKVKQIYVAKQTAGGTSAV
ncbi:hypothetical protein Droror1_Dr00010710 [Drosera rotundifolia]